jgi:hypothetical protein
VKLEAISRAIDSLRQRFPFATNQRLLAVLAALLGLYGTQRFAGVVHKVYPIDLWLFWNVATIWLFQALFAVGCLGVGLLVIERVLKLGELPGLERVVLGMACGVVMFTLAMYLGGALGWYGPVFAVALPVALATLGHRQLWSLLRSTRAALAEPEPRSPWVWLITAFGVLCAGLVYLPLFTPDSINYDATWCHITIAQDYARAGRIVPFLGDYSRNVPHLTSILHTWGYTVPGLKEVPLRWMMALHTEFHLFLWTLAGISAAVRWLTDDQNLRAGWVGMFLFPFIFVYDHSLGGAADHVLAFFGPPLLLAGRHLWQRLSPGAAALLGGLAGGALLTKYQAIYLVAPLVPLLALRWLLVVVARWRKRSLPLAADAADVHRWAKWAPLVVAVVAILVSAPHFIKNAVFYKNPVYPFMQNVFTASTPTVPEAWFTVEYVFKDKTWVPTGTSLQKLEHVWTLFKRFSFEPHYSFTNNYPGFGSLFTLLLPAVLLVRPRRRLAFAAVMAAGGLVIWALTFNVDRNLQIIAPVMACVTTALVVQVWRLGPIARLGLVPLVALQLIWGADAPFYTAHARVAGTMELARSGFEGRAAKRFDNFRREQRELTKKLPREARVLLHNEHVSLGVDREVVLDWTGFQGFIDYSGLKSPRELHAYYRERGLTHLLFVPRQRPASSRQEEVLWNAYVTRHAEQVANVGPYRLMKVASKPPAREPPYRVASFGMYGYVDGVYPIEAMNTSEYLWPAKRRYAAPQSRYDGQRATLDAMLSEVDAVFFANGSPLERTVAGELRGWTDVKYAGQFSLYLRKR